MIEIGMPFEDYLKERAKFNGGIMPTESTEYEPVKQNSLRNYSVPIPAKGESMRMYIRKEDIDLNTINGFKLGVGKLPNYMKEEHFEDNLVVTLFYVEPEFREFKFIGWIGEGSQNHFEEEFCIDLALKMDCIALMAKKSFVSRSYPKISKWECTIKELPDDE